MKGYISLINFQYIQPYYDVDRYHIRIPAL